MSKRILSVILLICMLVNNLPAAAFAEESTSGCSHVCDEICGFAEEVACDKDCPAGEAHAEDCAYQPGSECAHQHNGQCGVACTHAYAEGVCAICGETEPQPQPCEHTGGEATCEVLAVCELCKESYGQLAAHVYEEGKCACGDVCEHTFAEGICTLCGMEEPETEPVCTCDSDDPVLHAPFCDLFVRSETPACDCQVSCLAEELNPYCEVCYFNGAENCTGGEESAVPYAEPYDLWVGGVQVTSDNKGDLVTAINQAANTTVATGSATYDPENYTLTLDNFSYTGEGYKYDNYSSAAIYTQNNLTVNLVGSNSLTCTNGEGIISSYGLMIQGTDKDTDTLTVTSTSNNITVHHITISKATITASNITAYGNASITDSIVNADLDTSGFIWAISGTICVTSSTINFKNDNGLEGNGVTITDSTITTTDGKSSSIESSGVIEIVNSNVTVANDGWPAISADTSLTIRNSTVNATTTGTSNQMPASGILAGGNITVEGSQVTASGTDSGIFTMSGMSVSDSSTVTATGGEWAMVTVDNGENVVPLVPTFTGTHRIYAGTASDGITVTTDSTSADLNGVFENKYVRIEPVIPHTHSIDGSSGTQEWTPISSLDEITTSGYYCLEKDVTLSENWTPVSGTVLCLNGHDITFTSGCVYLRNTSEFTLTDCEPGGDVGKITGGTGYSNNNGSSYGGGVYVRGGTFTMYGGKITGNSASYGGGVWTHNSDTTKFYMYGGEIKDNTSSYGDVFLNYGGAQLILSGSPKIEEVYMPNNATPIIIGTSGLNDTAGIGVKLYDKDAIAAVGADPNLNLNDYLKCFQCLNNNSAFGVVDNKIRIASQKRTVRFDVDFHGTDFYGEVELGGKVAKPADPTASGYTFKGWYRDRAFETEWNFDTGIVTSDMLGTRPEDRDQFLLYAKWELNAVTFTEQNGYSDTYDRAEHEISVTVTHDALDNTKDHFTYQWYKDEDGVKVEVPEATSSTYNVKDVAQSGIYYCKVIANDTRATNANNKLTSEAWSNPITVSISKADQAAPTNLGHEDETIAQKADGKITGLNSDMEYKRSADTVYTPVTGATLENLAAGEYHIRCKEQLNYNASEPVSITIAKGRMLTVTLPDQPVGYSLAVSGGGKAEAVYNGEIKLELSLAEGYERNESFRLTATNNTGVTEENGIFTISGITDDVEVSVTGIVDVTFPTAEITVATNKWSSFLKDITFGIFFKETQAVTIDAQDVGSGVKTIEYYLSETEMSLDQVKAIRTWSGYNGSFSIDAEKQYVIYAKVTDNAENGGNTVYINSNGIVMDKTAPIFSGVTDGNEYYTTQKVTVTETNLLSLTCNGFAVESPITLEGNKDFTYEIVATDKAGNSSKITVVMNPVENLSVPLPEDTTLELDDKEEIEALKENVSSIWANNLSNITDEEEAALKAIIARCDALLQIIANVNNVNDQIKALKAPAEISPDEIDVILAYDDALEAYEKLTKRGKELVDTNELAKLEAVGKALTAYDVIKGHKSSYVKGSFKTISIVANGYYDVFGKYADGAFGKFREVRIDGEFLDPQYYTAASGSTVITLKTSYLESLETGKHYIQFVYVDGSTDGNDYFRISVNNGSPMTDDNSHILMFTGMAVTSLLCAAMLIVFFPRKKGKYER